MKHLNSYGFYSYGDKHFTTKNQALGFAQIIGDNDPIIRCVFHDDVYSSIDWQQEPEQSLQHLYRERAKQLRATYDYLIVLFSGGVDSDNMVRSFLDAGVFIDEIQTYWPLEIANRIETNNNVDDPLGHAFEYKLAVLPKLKEFQVRSPNTKINVIDSTQFLKDNWNEKFLANHALNMRPTRCMYIALQHYFIIDTCSDICEKTNKKVGVVYGADRVRPYIEMGEVRCKFYETGFSGFQNTVYGHGAYTPELFYWSKDAPLIPVKQLHLLKKELETNDRFYYHVLFPEQPRRSGAFRTAAETYANKIIYPQWDNRYQKLFKIEVDAVAELFIPHSNAIIDLQDAYLKKCYSKYPWATSKFYSAGKLRR